MKGKKSQVDRDLVLKYFGVTVPDQKREYVKGGRNGKFKGFNFYIQSNGKITKNSLSNKSRFC